MLQYLFESIIDLWVTIVILDGGCGPGGDGGGGCGGRLMNVFVCAPIN